MVREMFRELIRKARQLPEEECIAVLKSETRGVLSVIGEGGYPYGSPMNHWYNDEDRCIYFHCGNIGHRLDALRQDDRASFCVYTQGEHKEGDWAWTVKSVIVFGKIEIIDEMPRIVDITTRLSRKFGLDDATIEEEIRDSGHRTLLLKLTPENICGKLVREA